MSDNSGLSAAATDTAGDGVSYLGSGSSERPLNDPGATFEVVKDAYGLPIYPYVEDPWTGWTADPVEHPAHYEKTRGNVECIDIAETFDALLAQVIQYLWRCEDKGNELEDLKKARWFLNRRISNLEAANG